MIIRKADIYFRSDVTDIRVSLTLDDSIDTFHQIRESVAKHGNGLKLESIYFSEEEKS